ncbi:UDP-N-acetylglucosamine-N-acetylmuramylpentapeptide N-acetylglucosamine transferase [Alicyclobacillus hesperidum]|uniref:UDP-N-acetylglucosamine--N-acetylmuramyl-(pentapeptide) pyrophosphoryl-undecaprenol N-acetylglucosamine transferase n=1 Tax=Alicyclobacillus hesperidum TaxID=89784 RepID=A0A1H2UZJ6_9BACL|nr:undecaprenyldiphospho-muramoylpentapeptide beta-N-acetylglucosaminyltransferase [Alicyclobacillus hesperidum]SDW61488.1 UDP-N-acetylglucosamine-N-acetylmuramylpentapeptide N-acetylglucosamine transferase [Alicyclobacillus hesperidum]
MKVVLTGGGTGGHIYPALSLWRYMQRRIDPLDCLYIGTRNGLEQSIVRPLDLPFVTVDAAGLRRQVSLQAVRTLLVTARGYFQARRLLRRFRPDVVVGTGGFVTLPVVFAAKSLGIPSVIWEGNARPGLTNQLCARKSEAVAVCFPESERYFRGARRVVLTGNPRASEVISVDSAAKRQALDTYRILRGQKVVLIFTGSRGSESVNRMIAQMLPRFAQHPDWRCLFVTGEAHYDETVRELGALPRNVSIHPFISDMPSLLPHVDLIISRAGSSTLAEICALGIASILIPSPYVTANHQEENARNLVHAGAALMIREQDLTVDRLWDGVVDLLKPDKLAVMKERAKSFGQPEAVERLYDLVMSAVRS